MEHKRQHLSNDYLKINRNPFKISLKTALIRVKKKKQTCLENVKILYCGTNNKSFLEFGN